VSGTSVVLGRRAAVRLPVLSLWQLAISSGQCACGDKPCSMTNMHGFLRLRHIRRLCTWSSLEPWVEAHAAQRREKSSLPRREILHEPTLFRFPPSLLSWLLLLIVRTRANGRSTLRPEMQLYIFPLLPVIRKVAGQNSKPLLVSEFPILSRWGRSDHDAYLPQSYREIRLGKNDAQSQRSHNLNLGGCL